MEIIMKAVLMILLAHLILGVYMWYRVRKLYRYPNLFGFPVFGNLYHFYRTLFLFDMPSAYNYIVSGIKDIGNEGFGFYWISGSSLTMVVTNPDLVKKLSLHPNLADKPKMHYGGLNCVMGGPFTKLDSDDEWKVMKKDYNNALKRSRIDNNYYVTFIRYTNKMVDTILASSSSDFDAHTVFVGFSLDIAIKSLFGFETSLVYHPDISKIAEKINEVGSVLGTNSMLISVVFPLLKPMLDIVYGKKVVEIRKLVVEETNNKLISNQYPTSELPLSVLVGSRHKRNNTSEKLYDELTGLLITSGHTVSSTLTNTIYFLATLPDIQERAWQEQNEIFGNDKRDPTIADLNQMKFLDRFIKETLRFTSPTFLAKKASADIIVDGITIPCNTTVAYLVGYMSFHPKYWENPNVFDPDRFLKETDSTKHCSIPFGIGIRKCPGIYFATTLMKITLSKFLRRLIFRPVEKGFRFEDIKFKNILFAEVENPPKLQIEERK